MQLLNSIILIAASVTAVQAASLNAADRLKVETAKSLLRLYPKPQAVTLDQICYSILGANRPAFKTATSILPVSSATETDTSTETAPTPVTTATSTSTVTVTSHSASIVQRGQPFDSSAVRAQFKAFVQPILDQVSDSPRESSLAWS